MDSQAYPALFRKQGEIIRSAYCVENVTQYALRTTNHENSKNHTQNI